MNERGIRAAEGLLPEEGVLTDQFFLAAKHADLPHGDTAIVPVLGSSYFETRKIRPSDVIDDLLLPLLQGLGLVEALHALADNFSGDIPVHLEVPPEDTELVEARSLALFRIAHEALTNIRKYANASHVRLGLSLADDQVCIWIKDDGVGFDPNMTTITRYGLAGVKHRVLMFAGGFVPTSAPGKGTRGEARMPAQPGSRHH